MLFKKTQLLVFLFTIIFSSFTFSQTTCNDTSWDKAVDFDGANQHLKQVSQNTGVNAIRMAGQSQTVALGSNVGYTTNVGEKYLEQSKNYLDRQFSPMCWMKTTTGELKKFFLIWWECITS